MGKAKRRSLNNGINDKYPSIKREDALNEVIEKIQNRKEVIDKITLFDFTAEEMLEAGAAYEDVMAFGGLIH
jgi:hypothetical protein